MYRWATGWVTWVWFAPGVEIFSYCCYHNQTTSDAWCSLGVGDSCLLGQWPVYRANNSYTLVLRLRMILRLWVRIALSIKLSSTSVPVHLRMGTDPVSISIKLSRYLTTFSSENGNIKLSSTSLPFHLRMGTDPVFKSCVLQGIPDDGLDLETLSSKVLIVK